MLLVLLEAALSLLPCTSAWAADSQKKVLLLYSLRRDTQLAVAGDRLLPDMLRQAIGSVDVYSEYMDLPRFPEPQYEQALVEYLSLKYNRRPFDLIVAIQDVASDFVAKHHDDLFAGSPVVFAATEPPRIANATGIRLTLDFAKTIALATTLQPDTREVFVVSGASARDKVYEDIARTQLRRFQDRLAITYLSDTSAPELERRLATLPEHSIIFYVLFYQDATGENFEPVDYLERVTSVANRPVYSWTDTTIGKGVVGGALRSAQAQLEAIGTRAIQVLRGTRPERIGVTTPDLFVDQVDWRQLQRWRLSAARVPADTLVLFREPGPWERYRGYILAASGLILLQMALIAGLLVQRSRRRRAEAQLRDSQKELGTSYKRVRDLGARLLGAQEAERSRIARELHDDIGQQLAVLSVTLGLVRRAARGESGNVDDLLFSTFERINEMARHLHDIEHRLHPASLRLIGLVPALAGLSRELSSSGMDVTVTCDQVPDHVPHDLTLCMYRVAQEAAHNAARHGRCRRLTVHLDGSDQRLMLTVADDGIGFDVERQMGRGLGLISMRERLEALGGTLRIDSVPGSGCRVEATAPFPVTRSDGSGASSNPRDTANDVPATANSR
jgi:signal transduction histidine kinase